LRSVQILLANGYGPPELEWTPLSATAMSALEAQVAAAVKGKTYGTSNQSNVILAVLYDGSYATGEWLKVLATIACTAHRVDSRHH
ncbi:hypothetical protein BCR44DRAFT_1436098, partial [Catenaria anguillulae PL171]